MPNDFPAGVPARATLFTAATRGSSMSSRTLYRLEGCPYCERVVDRLAELDLEFESVWVEGMHSRRDVVKRVSGQREVPVLVESDRGTTMAESGRIMAYLDNQYGAATATDAGDD